MKEFFIRWLVTTIVVAVAVKLTGMQTEGWGALVLVALLLGIMNAVVRPILLVLSIPFILVTLGFFILILNGLMLWLAGALVPGFAVNGFGNAFFGSIIVSIVSWVFSAFFRDGNGRYQSISQHSQMKQVRGRVVE